MGVERLAAHSGGARCLAFSRYLPRCVIAIALNGATAATGKEFSDFLIDRVTQTTKLGAYYDSVSIAATGVGVRHHVPRAMPWAYLLWPCRPGTRMQTSISQRASTVERQLANK
jgi:hypothetical protein